MAFSPASLTTFVAVFLLMSPTFAVHLEEYLDQLELVKKTQCVSASGDCFNAEQCCNGLSCVASRERGDSLETPGQCVKSKDLKTCRSVDDCYLALGSESSDTGDTSLRCAPLNAPSSISDTTSQRYCIRRSTSSSAVVGDLTGPGRSVNQGNGPRKHHAYSSSRVLANIAGSCETDADCQMYADGTNTRLCCQQISQGRQGTRRICDRVTAISICIPSPIK